MGRKPKLGNQSSIRIRQKSRSIHAKLVSNHNRLEQLKTIKVFVELNSFCCDIVHNFNHDSIKKSGHHIHQAPQSYPGGAVRGVSLSLCLPHVRRLAVFKVHFATLDFVTYVMILDVNVLCTAVVDSIHCHLDA